MYQKGAPINVGHPLLYYGTECGIIMNKFETGSTVSILCHILHYGKGSKADAWRNYCA